MIYNPSPQNLIFSCEDFRKDEQSNMYQQFS